MSHYSILFIHFVDRHILFTRSSVVHGHLGFHFLAVANSPALYKFLCEHKFLVIFGVYVGADAIISLIFTSQTKT